MRQNKMGVRRGVAIVVSILSAGPPAFGQDVGTCNAAYERADVLIHGPNSDKLLEARESVRTCAGTGCQSWMIKDCTQWLSDLERRIPSVVLLASDAFGNDVAAVVVTVDATIISTRLDGRAIEMNPGERTFVFEGPGGERVERKSLIREGEKDQVVAVTFEGSEYSKEPASAARDRRRFDDSVGTVQASEASVRAPGGKTALRPPGSLVAAPSSETLGPWRAIGYVACGVGAAAAAVGAVLGVMAIASNNASNADGHCVGGCDAEGASLRDRAVNEANASTVTIAIGATLLAPGIALLIFAPAKKTRSLPSWSPFASAHAAGMALSGAF
jgi:hypothetical protein